MKLAYVSEIAAHLQTFGGDFPLRFRWQALPGPFGERIGLVKADVADGFGRVQPAAPGQRKNRPLTVFAGPIKWRLPALLAGHPPAIRKPELGFLIAAGL